MNLKTFTNSNATHRPLQCKNRSRTALFKYLLLLNVVYQLQRKHLYL